ncbi:hypothetical protein [Paenibacillus sp. IHBB 3054]|uniref:hypothetical protein n=1 Tax=Paenibacillus sp. IHBB 3054 TaxID=3425689 RepID=UPI003F67539B
MTKINENDIPIKRSTIAAKPRFEKIHLDLELTMDLTSTAKFLIAPLLVNGHIEDGRVVIPADDSWVYKKMLGDLGAHYSDITKITSNEGIDLSFSNINPNSIEIFNTEFKNDNFLNKVLKELFEDKNCSEDLKQTNVPHNQTIYKVDLHEIDSLNVDEMDEIWRMLKSSYIRRSGLFSILPNRWLLDNSFNSYLTIRWLSSVCEEMFISVSDDTNLITVISFK